MHSTKKLLLGLTAFFCIVSAMRPATTAAATTPSLGEAATFGVLGGTYTNTSAATTVNGDIGFTTGPAVRPLGTQTNYGSGAPTPTARTDAALALTALGDNDCTFEWIGAVDLSTDPTHGTVGVFTPGVYCSSGAMSISAALTLSGSGTYIFRAVGALTSTAGSIITLSGASACDVFWTPTAATTLGATTTFMGTIIDNANAITVGANTEWTGRALSLGAGTVTTGSTSTITAPSCTPLQGTLHVVKTVVNDNGGTLDEADFSFSIDGAAAQAFEADGQNDVTVDAGTYTITEPAVAGYTTSYSNCSDIVVASGGEATCTMTNNDIAPILYIAKSVTNDNGGTAVASAFTLSVKLAGVNVTGSPATGVASPGRSYTLNAGTYAVSEAAGLAYTSTFSGDCTSGGSVTLAIGDTKTCVVTNNDIAPILHVIKTVINDDAGTAVAAAFSLHVTLGGVEVAGSPAAGTGAPGTSYTLNAGTYVVQEDEDADYTPAFSGACDANGNVTLVIGDDVTCSITNDDIEPVAVPTSDSGHASPPTGTINVVKLMVNDNGGTKTINDFPLFLNDVPIASGATGTFTANSSRYLVTETADVNYVGTFSGDCDAEGVMYLHPGEHLFCVLTNDDTGLPVAIPPIPPLIDIVKIPSPLALPEGPGMVSYAFTVRNIGTVPITNVTVVDDHCTPARDMTSDTNTDDALDSTETWMYSCSAELAETTTNIVVATGWANGLSTTDIASATVVVGAPIIPPLIHVTKIPNPFTLLAEGGLVTYIETITNPGTVALSNVTLTDDECSPVDYISGDTNEDALLDTTESWIYTCSSYLRTTTTNITVASGEANGLTARDYAIVTIVAASMIPSFPNTGVVTSAGPLLLAGIAFICAVLLYLAATHRLHRR